MSQIKIQEYIKQEIIINHMSRPKKGSTMVQRDDRSEKKWTAFMIERGYTEWDAAVIFKDAHDVAMIELRCEAAAA